MPFHQQEALAAFQVVQQELKCCWAAWVGQAAPPEPVVPPELAVSPEPAAQRWVAGIAAHEGWWVGEAAPWTDLPQAADWACDKGAACRPYSADR